MRLIIGGFAQGKLDYAVGKYGKPDRIWDGGQKSGLPEQEGSWILNHLHLWIREKSASADFSSEKLTELLLSWIRRHPDCILICDEIGAGIVPAEAKQREWREATGRICIRLAAEAESVERVVCGLGQRLK